MCSERPANVADPPPRLRTKTRADAAYLQRVAVAVPRDRFVLQGRCPTGRVVPVREVADANVGLGPVRGASQDLVCAPDQLRRMPAFAQHLRLFRTNPC